jgi:hypothetical protein
MAEDTNDAIKEANDLSLNDNKSSGLVDAFVSLFMPAPARHGGRCKQDLVIAVESCHGGGGAHCCWGCRCLGYPGSDMSMVLLLAGRGCLRHRRRWKKLLIGSKESGREHLRLLFQRAVLILCSGDVG